MKIAFILTSTEISGGHNIIFEHAFNLQRRGHHVDILGKNLEQFKYVYSWHDRAEFLNFKSIQNTYDHPKYDIAIATNYHSVFFLPLVSARHYSFLMQAKEGEFGIEGDCAFNKWLSSVLTLKLPTIVIASWMQKYLYREQNQESCLCLNGIRKDLFCPHGETISPRPNKGLRVLVEGPLCVPHKNVKATLDLCLASEAKEVWLITRDSNTSEVPKQVFIFSSVATKDLASIYRSCDVLVKLSTKEGMFGPPLEMFHCGGTVISCDVSGHEEYLLDGINSLIVPMGEDQSIINAISKLHWDGDLLAKLKAGAINTASKWSDWETSSKILEEGLMYLIQNYKLKESDLFQAIENSTKQYLKEKWLEKKVRQNITDNILH